MNSVQLQFNNQLIDISEHEDFPLSINKSVAEIQDIGKRGGSYTKSFRLPATAENNRAFAFLYNEHLKQDDGAVQAVRAKIDCSILVDSIVVMKGYARITAAFKKQQAEYYELTVFSDNMDWINQLRNKKLNELDFGDSLYNKYTIQGIQQDTYPTTEFQYPLVNYGDFLKEHKVTTGDMRPAPYMVAMVYKAFNNIGYKVQSNFLQNTDIEQIIYPYTSGEDWKNIQPHVDPHDTEAESSTLITFDNSRILAFASTIADPHGQIVNSTISLLSIPYTRFQAGHQQEVMIELDVNVSFSSSADFDISLRIEHIRSGSTYEEYSKTFQFDNEAGTHSLNFTKGPLVLKANDSLRFYIEVSDTISVDVLAGSTLKVKRTTSIYPGDTYSVGKTLSSSISQFDFLQGLVGVFNLYIDADSLARTVTIEPRNDWKDTSGTTISGYYKGQEEAIDWSDKLDVGGGIQLKFLSDYKRTLIFRYKEDSGDGFMKRVEKGYPYGYHAYVHQLSERFPEGEQTIGSKLFAMSHHVYYRKVSYRASFDPDTQPPAILMPRFYATDTDADQEIKHEWKPRLFTYKYTLEANRYGRHPLPIYEDDGSPSLPVPALGVPKAFVVNHDKQDDFQLSYETVGSDGMGLFERFFAKTIPDIEEGLVYTASFKLTTTDIATLDFRKPIYVLGQYYYLNKLIDYQPTRNQLTKVELIRVFNQQPINISRSNPDEEVLQDEDLSGSGVISPNVPIISIGQVYDTYGKPIKYTSSSGYIRSISLDLSDKDLRNDLLVE